MNHPPAHTPSGDQTQPSEELPQHPSSQGTGPTTDGRSKHSGDTLPTVSVVVLNYNGLRYLNDCFRSLLELDYPEERLEMVLADNGSTDGSLEFMRMNFPTVRVIQTGSNLGFAAGNNYGAQHATGEYVAFLNNDTRVEPNWLSELVRAMLTGRDAGVICTSSLILNWSGDEIDFQAGALNFHGFGFQPSYGLPVRGRELVPRELLFACGGSMLIKRDVFLDVGGFDPDYFAFFEDVDLGWRLWLLGYKVMLTPTAVTYHRHHGTAGTMAHHRVQVLYERNALYTLYKNYEDANLEKILPAALLLLGQRAVRFAELGGVDFADYEFNNLIVDTGSTENVHRNAVATLLAVNEFSTTISAFQQKREFVQARRKRSDAEMFALFGQPGRVHLVNHSADGPYSSAHFALLHEFGIEDLWSDLPKEVLVISPDVLPVGEIPATGSGIRAWALGKGLESKGHHVHFTMPGAALQGREHQLPAEYEVGAWTPENLQQIVDTMAPDVVVSCGWPNLTWLHRSNVPVALDLAGPHLLERAYQHYRDVGANSLEKLNGLRKADFYSCISTRQKYYFTGWLMQAGVDVEQILDSLSVIPYSLDPIQPEHVWDPAAEVRFVYGGIFLPWQNPASALLTVARTLEEENKGYLDVIGGKHPFHAVDIGGFGPLVDMLAEMPRVRMSDLLPYDELVKRYTQAHVAVDVMMPNPERELAFPSRTVHYLWCGLPVIHSEFSEVAHFIREYEAGWIVPHDDPKALRDVVIGVLANPIEAQRRGQNAQRLVQECFSWDQTADLLDKFVRRPYIRADRNMRSNKKEIRQGAASISDILMPVEGPQLPRRVQTLYVKRRNPGRQLVARSGSLLKDLLPMIASRRRSSLATHQPCFALSELTKGHSHGQRFFCPHDGLSGLQVEIATHGRRNACRLMLHLRDHPASRADIYALELNSYKLKDGQPVSFRFPAIRDSGQKWFYLMAECPDGVPGDAVSLMATNGPGVVESQRYEDGLPAGGSLLLRLEFGESKS